MLPRVARVPHSTRVPSASARALRRLGAAAGRLLPAALLLLAAAAPLSGQTVSALGDHTAQENQAWSTTITVSNGVAATWTFRTQNGQDNNLFTLTPAADGASVVLSLAAQDFENPADANGDNKYQVSILVTFAGGSANRMGTITVQNVVDEEAALAISGLYSTTRIENESWGPRTPTVTGHTGTVTWSASGADAALFDFDPSNGRISLPPQDYENPVDADGMNTYEVTVTATDGGGNTGSVSITITVTNRASELNLALSDASVAENMAWSTTFAVGTETYSATVTASGPDGALFTVTPNINGTANARISLPAQDYEAPADADRNNKYEVTVFAEDRLGASGSATITVTVTDVDDGGTTLTITGLSDASVQENTAWSSGTPSVEGATGDVTWTKSGDDEALFTLDASTGALSLPAQDFELPADSDTDNDYNVTVTATDANSVTGSVSITVTVTDENGDPLTFTGLEDASVAENTVWSTTFTVISTTGLNGVAKSGDDAALFELTHAWPENTAVLSLPAQDYEMPADKDGSNTYEVTVTATDGWGDTGSKSITITVTDVDDGAPSLTISGLEDTSVAENTAYSATATVSGNTGDVTWSLSGDDSDDFTISDSGVLSMTARNFESPTDSDTNNTYSVTVKATDENDVTGEVSITVTVTDVAESLTVSGLSDASVAENTPWTDTATVAGATGDVTWSLSGDDSDDFSISAAGVLSLPARDYENPSDSDTNNTYNVTVTATDADNITGEASITVTVTDESESVTVSGLADASVEENTAWADTATATGATGDVTWSLSGDDADDFSISAAGVLSLAEQNFEAPADSDTNNTYNVTVTATDENDLTGEASITVTVTDVTESATITIGGINANVSVEENTAFSGTLTATGAIGDVTWSKTGGLDQGLFTLDTSTGALSLPAQDFENPVDQGATAGNNTYRVNVRATDEDGNNETRNITLTVTDVQEVVTLTITGLADASVNENTAWTGTPTLSANAIGAVTWTKTGDDAGDFTLDASTGALTLPAQDYEAPADSDTNNTYKVTLTATDADDNTVSASITVTVTDVAESTLAISGLADASVNENEIWTATPTVSGNTGTVTLSLSGDDADKFTLDAMTNELRLGRKDYESPTDANTDNDYEVTVSATDDANTVSVSITVTVVNVDPMGANIELSGGTAMLNQPENSAYSWTLTVSNHDGPVRWDKWKGADKDLFTLDVAEDGLSAEVTLPAQDYEDIQDANGGNNYVVEIRVRAGDEFNSSRTEITITDVANELTISGLSDASVAENTAYSATATITGHTGDVTWSLSGDDADDFSISDAGALSLPARDFENPTDSDTNNTYNVTVTATDGNGDTGAASVTVTVTDVAESLTVSGLADASVAENTAWSSGTPTVTGATGDVTWALSGDDADDFSISDTGVLSLPAKDWENPTDSDTNNTYNVTATATDANNLTGSASITVTVTDVNEATTLTISGLADADLAENTDYSATATAAGATGTVTWALSGDDADEFLISDTGVLTMTAKNFEDPEDSDTSNDYEVTVTATDANSVQGTISITVTVTDVQETATITVGGIADANQAENAAYSATATATGGIGDVTWSLSGDDASHFSITTAGVLSMAAKDFENPADNGTNNTYEVTVTATDEDGNTGEASITITITNVAEQSTITVTGLADADQAENSAYSATATADGAIGAVTWTLSGNDADDFGITNAGVLSMTAKNFESPVDSDTNNTYEVTVTATDTNNNTNNVSITITVTDVQEAANITIGGVNAAVSVEENTAFSGTLTATGQIGNVTWSKTGGADEGLFTLNASTGAISLPAQDFEDPVDQGAGVGNNTYRVNVRATDDDGNTANRNITLTVTDVTEAANIVIGGINAAVSVNENTAYSGTLTATGQIGGVTWSKVGGADEAKFTLTTAGALSLPAKNFENPDDSGANNTYVVQVRATDDDDNTADRTITVTVGDVTETVTLTITGLADATVNENTAYSATATVSTNAIGDVTWSKSGDDEGLFTLTAAGELGLAAQDFENPADNGSNNTYDVTVTATDDDGNTVDVSITITVANVAETATITIGGISSTSVEENQAYSATATSTGHIGTVTWSKTGADEGDFTLNTTSGALSLPAQSFEEPADSDENNTYHVTLTATDGDNNTATLSIIVTVTDVQENRNITISGISSTSVAENQAYSATAAVSTNAIGDVTWSKSGGADQAKFTLDASTGALSLPAKNYEEPDDSDTANTYVVTVRATDEDDNTTTETVTITVTDVNEPANITIGGIDAAVSVEENTAYSGTLTASGQIGNVTWSKSGGADEARFALTAAGVLSLPELNFEQPQDSDTNNTYVVEVKATDDDENTQTRTITVTVTNVVESSNVTISGLSDTSVEENSAYSASPSTTGAIGAVTWTKSGADAARFTLTASTGALSLPAKSFEEPDDSDGDNTYLVTVKATDSDNNSASVSIIVTVTNVVEVRNISIAGLPSTVTRSENYAHSDTLTASGAIGDVTWTKSGGADRALFTLTTAADGRTAVLSLPAQDYEDPKDAGGDNTYRVTVRAVDADGNQASKPHTVTIANVDDGGIGISGLPEADLVAENTAWGPVTPTVSGHTGAVTWSKTGPDAARFTQNASTGALSLPAQDFENPADANGNNQYEVTVTATDANNNSASRSVTIIVTDVDESTNIVISGLSNASVPENSAWGPVTPTVSGHTGTVTWSKSGADAARFTLNTSTGALSLAAQDFEAPADADGNNAYEVTVTATDANNNSASRSVTITVTDVDETPPPPPPTTPTLTVSGLSSGSVAENAAWGPVTPTVTGATGAVTWSKSGADEALFTLSASTGALSLPAQDFEEPADADGNNTYEVTVTATDAGNNTAETSITVTVTDVDETTTPPPPPPPPPTTPTLTVSGLASTSVAENAAWGPVTPTVSGATGAVTWSKSGADEALFTLNPSTGALSLPAQDFEAPADADGNNTYEVTVTATDAGNNSAATSITVTVTDVDDSSTTPTLTISGLSSGSVAENSAWGPVTPTVSGATGAVTWSKSGADEALFTQNARTGALSLPAQDFENPRDADGNNTYEVTVRAADGTNSGSASVTITVTDVNESPTLTISGLANASVAENVAWGPVTPTVSGATGTVTWSRSGADAALFRQNSRTGVLSLPAQDFESPRDADGNNTYEVTVTAMVGTRSGSASVTITVTDVDESPPLTISGLADASVEENAAWGPVTPTVSGATGTVTWSKSGADAARFTLNASTGALSLPAQDFENPQDADGGNTYEVTVRATDAGSRSATASVTVTVTDVDEKPLPTIAVANADPVTEGGAGDVTDMSFAVTLSLAAEAAVTVGYAASGATPGTDYEATSGTLTFEAGTTMRTIAVPVLGDDEVEPNETVTLTLSDPANVAPSGHTLTASGIIRNDDELEVSAPGTFNVGETEVTVTGTPPAGVEVTLPPEPGESSIAVTFSPADAESPPAGTFGHDAGSLVDIDVSPVPADGVDICLPVSAELAAEGGDGVSVLRYDGSSWIALASTYDAAAGRVCARVTSFSAFAAGYQREALAISGLADASVAENSEYSATATATGAVGDVAWSKEGADEALFGLDAATGALTLPAQDFEEPADADGNNTYEVTVTASDSIGRTASVSVTVSVTDVDEAAVEVSVSVPAMTRTPTFQAFFRFSGEVTGFELSDIAVSNGTASGLTGSGASYEATITAASEGPVTVTVLAGSVLDAAGNPGPDVAVMATTVYDSPVDQRLERANAMRSGLGGLNRGLAAAVDVIDTRFSPLGRASRDGASASLGGRNLDMDQGAAGLFGDAAALLVERFHPGALGFGGSPEFGGGAGSFGGGLGGPMTGGGFGGSMAGGGFGRGSGLAGLARGSSFQTGGTSGGLSLWGQARSTRFSGGAVSGYSADGQVDGWYGGADYTAGRATVGVAVSQHRSETDVAGDGAGAGALDANLTSILPYLRLSPWQGGSLWVVAGAGRGQAILDSEADGASHETDLGMRMAAAGASSDLVRAGALVFSLKADASAIGTEAESTADIEGVDVWTRRGRVALGARAELGLSPASRLVPSVEAGARMDDGDVANGAGMEVGGGLRFANTRLGIDMLASGRWLVAHEDRDFDEWGAGVLLKIGRGGMDRPGLSLSMEPSWGSAASQVDRLWRNGAAGGAFGTPFERAGGFAASEQVGRVNFDVSYGIAAFGNGLLAFHGASGMEGRSRRSRVGVGLRVPSGFRVELLGEELATGIGPRRLVGLDISGEGLAGGGMLAPLAEFRLEGPGSHRVRLGARFGDVDRLQARGLSMRLFAEHFARPADGSEYRVVLGLSY